MITSSYEASMEVSKKRASELETRFLVKATKFFAEVAVACLKQEAAIEKKRRLPA